LPFSGCLPLVHLEWTIQVERELIKLGSAARAGALAFPWPGPIVPKSEPKGKTKAVSDLRLRCVGLSGSSKAVPVYQHMFSVFFLRFNHRDMGLAADRHRRRCTASGPAGVIVKVPAGTGLSIAQMF
jgi:hypothetical protein